MKYIFSILFVLLFSTTFAQFNFSRKDSIKIVIGDTLLSPFAGGFNNPQFSNIDLDQDGVKDVFVFDRSCDEIRTFVYKNIDGTMTLVHDPVYENQFPLADMRYRAALVDYNCDGKEDIFTYFIGGLRVYKNTSNPVDGLQFELEYFHVKSDYNGTYTNAYVSSGDIPALVDIDGDSDLDILSFSVGGEVVEYHRNLAIENFGRCDTLVYEVRNYCWGKFREDMSSNSIVLDDNSAPCNGVDNYPIPEKTSSHVGSTVLAIDVDASGTMDLIIGDATYKNLVLLTNSGSTPNTNSILNSIDDTYPNDMPADINVFPASFYIDADNDGIKDLVAAPNYKGLSNNVESAWWWKNNGANNLPNFQFQSKTFLQSDMVDVGSGSIPVFVDVNGDGLEDLIVSNFYHLYDTEDKESRFQYYENVGDANNAIFKLSDINYLDMNSFGFGLRLVPAFADIDNDGDLDMYVGNQLGDIHFFRNSAGPNNPLNLSLETSSITDFEGTSINVGSYSAPTLFDLNGDLKIDLIIGDKAGKLWYYKNIGTAEAPSFEKVSQSLGLVDASPLSNEGYAHPQFLRVNDTTHLFVGARDGFIHYYDDIDGNIADGDAFNVVSDAFLDIHTGTFAGIAIKDLNNNNKLDMFYGNDLGGLVHYEGEWFDGSIGITSYELSLLGIYPNPTTGDVTIEIPQNLTKDLFGSTIQVLSLDGKILIEKKVYQSKMPLNISGLTNGIYLVKIGNQFVPHKLIKQ